MNPRRILFWAHLIAGCVVGLFILFMAGTGILLSFERQIVAWAERDLRVQPVSENQAPLPLAEVMAKITAGAPAGEAPIVTIPSQSDLPLIVRFGKAKMLLADPYTGESLGSGHEATRGFFKTVVGLHRWLALEGEWRETGKAITGATCLCFLFLLISGLILWVPRQWSKRALRAIAVPQIKLKGRARDWNWHNAFGLWASPVLLVIILTGLVIAYPWATNLLYTINGETPPPPRQEGKGGGGKPAPVAAAPTNWMSTDALLAKVKDANPGWKTISLKWPDASTSSIAFTVDQGNGARPDLRSGITLHRETGEMVSQDRPQDRSTGLTWRQWSRWLHTGEALGLPGQIAAFLGSAAAIVLIWTGFALAWRRFTARKRNPAPALSPAEGARVSQDLS